MKVVSRKVLNGLNRKTSLSKGYSKRTSAENLFPFVRTFGPKIPVQMFAHFISKLLCNIYQSLDVRDE